MPKLGRSLVTGVITVVAALWVASGVYMVQADELGVVLRFGKLTSVTEPGLNYHLPYPIETVETPQVTEVKRVEIGFRTVYAGPPARYEQIPEESLMLTGDENIVDINLIVQFKIKDPAAYLFEVRDVYITVKSASEATLRQVIGFHKIDEALTDGKFQIQQEIQDNLQAILDSYDAGVLVVAVQMQDVHPPEEVVAAFKDVASALEDKNKYINQAQGYQNDVIPRTRGQGEQLVLQAESYREQRILRAQGETERFISILAEYERAPAVTEKRLYLETMESVLPRVQKYITATGRDGANLIPLLDMRRTAPAAKP
ncbi:MAG TPA: FtsH protease activity modulator HflK [Candidatus Glassbacteria bacterium]|nr:FtsH protease activity modulator HflK [Candidatus Glassbacteria bacterium]